MSPLVSILIPCYNAERWIAACIESALGQTYPTKEVIVVDDGSTDGSLSVIERYRDVIRFESRPNRGGNPTRNRLLELASGEWVQYLDADDCLLPDKVASQMAFIAAQPNTDIVFGPVTMEHWDGETSKRSLLPIPEPHDLWILLARWYLPQTGAPLWRKQSIVDVGSWKPDQPCCQEHELYLRLLVAGKRFRYSASNGAIYRQWSEGTVCKKDRSQVRIERLKILAALEQHLKAATQLSEARLWAINMARFEMARTAWQRDHGVAREIMQRVRQTQSNFQPQGTAAPANYKLAYRFFGFTVAEWLADLRRSGTTAAS